MYVHIPDVVHLLGQRVVDSNRDHFPILQKTESRPASVMLH